MRRDQLPTNDPGCSRMVVRRKREDLPAPNVLCEAHASIPSDSLTLKVCVSTLAAGMLGFGLDEGSLQRYPIIHDNPCGSFLGSISCQILLESRDGNGR